MLGFLNERSIEQYGDWVASLQFFLAAARELLSIEATLFRDSRFFSRATFRQRFNLLSLPKDERAVLRDLAFGGRYYKCWTPDRVSLETERYTCADPAVGLVDESITEAAERKLVSAAQTVSILSAPDSTFRNRNNLIISKLSSGQPAELRNAATIERVRNWIISERGQYGVDSRTAPRDFQTVLIRDESRFRATGRLERRFSRHVFEELATGRLYYVDDGHSGHSAHLEVFSANGEHLGIADIGRGELDARKRVDGRVLRL